MSFARPKHTSRKTSPDNLKRANLGTSFTEANFVSPSQMRSAYRIADPDHLSRIEALEADLSKVSKQQDALLPLMNMMEIGPALTKNENLLKGVHKKNQETEDRITRLEQLMINYQQNIENTVTKINSAPKVAPVDTSFIEKGLKDVTLQMNKQANSIRDLESNFGNAQKSLENKVTETIAINSKAIEMRLEKQRIEFNTTITELNSNVDLSFKKFEEAVQELYGQVNRN